LIIEIIGKVAIDWTDLTQVKNQWNVQVKVVVKYWAPKNIDKFLESCTTGGFSRRA
jgi:hypothetical protein